jgi:methyl-accepting chemotaxis protein
MLSMTALGYDTGASFATQARPRARLSLATLVLVVGAMAMAGALVLVVAGVPASMYDADGAPNRNQNHSHDMLKMSQSIDGNMKYLVDKTGDDPGEYNGAQTSINNSEDYIASLSNAVGKLTGTVEGIDTSLNSVLGTTRQMGKGMQQMGTISSTSAATMGTLDANVSVIAASMNNLSTSTVTLADSVDGVEKGARNIANTRTGKARTIAKKLNATLPNGVPHAQLSTAPEVVAQ